MTLLPQYRYFEDPVLLSPSQKIWKLCELMMNVKKGIDYYKVPIVGKIGKLNETIELSVLWSVYRDTISKKNRSTCQVRNSKAFDLRKIYGDD